MSELQIWFDRSVYEYFAPAIEAYCEILLDRVDPIFNDVDGEAARAGQAFLSSIAHYFGRDDDPSDAYEAAQEHAYERASMFLDMRTVFLATGISGLFHLFEKQLYRHLNKELQRWTLTPISEWRDLTGLIPKFDHKYGEPAPCPDFISAFNDPDLQELMLVANSIKHGEDGPSYRKLVANGAIVVSSARLDNDGTVGPYTVFGVNLSVQADDLRRYRDAILRFWSISGTFVAPRSTFK